jgi:hypothetical protein
MRQSACKFKNSIPNQHLRAVHVISSGASGERDVTPSSLALKLWPQNAASRSNVELRIASTTPKILFDLNTMASSANPYDNHYNSPQVEDDDLIDPDDGTPPSPPSQTSTLLTPVSSKLRRPRRPPPTNILPRPSHR